MIIDVFKLYKVTFVSYIFLILFDSVNLDIINSFEGTNENYDIISYYRYATPIR